MLTIEPHLTDANLRPGMGQSGGVTPLTKSLEEEVADGPPAAAGLSVAPNNCEAEKPAKGPRATRRLLWQCVLLGPAVGLPLWTWAWTCVGRQPPITFLGLILLSLLVLAAVTDFRWHRIPNWATYTALLWTVALNAAQALGVPARLTCLLGTVGLTDSLLGGSTCFLCALVLFGTTGGGAGDVKLLTVIGAMLGLSLGILATLYGFIAAGAACLAWALWQYGPLAIIKAFGRLVGGFFFPRWVGRPTPEQVRLLRLPVPLAPFFALGTFLAVNKAWLVAWYR